LGVRQWELVAKHLEPLRVVLSLVHRGHGEQPLRRFRGYATLQQLIVYPVDTNFVQLVDGDQSRALQVRLDASDLNHTAQDDPVIQRNGHPVKAQCIQRIAHGVDYFDFRQQ
jgi:hypothetical protein